MGLIGVPLTAAVAMSASSVIRAPKGVEAQVFERLPESGVTNPVTSVLLNFRSFDTLLEVTVLILAVLGARAIAQAGERNAFPGPAYQELVLQGYVRWAAPVFVLAASYLLWVGGHAPGGAFQAGAVLAAGGVLLRLSGLFGMIAWPRSLERAVWGLGTAVFLAVGLVTAYGPEAFLEYPKASSKILILVIESACTVSIAAILYALFATGRDDSGSGELSGMTPHDGE
jgi:multisubunit Na+/H+ antiporter MnhB subunit